MTAEEKDIESMEDLIQAAGTTGWRNYLTFFFCAWVTFIAPMHSLSYQFLGSTPEFWCKIPELEKANWTVEEIQNFSIPLRKEISRIESCSKRNYNYSHVAEFDFDTGFDQNTEIFRLDADNHEEVPCKERTFDPNEPSTVVTKWDLVCERRAIYSTTQSVVHVGNMASAILMGYVIESFGRKKALVINIPLYLIAGLLMVVSPNAEFYIFLKGVQSFASMGFYMAGIILAMELCSTEQRSFIGAVYPVPWALSYMLLPIIAYYIRPFTSLQIVTTLPILTLFPCIWIIPESPRWLTHKGRSKEAIAILQRIAKYNRRTLPDEEKMKKFMENLKEDKKRTSKQNVLQSLQNTLHKSVSLFFIPPWTWIILILFLAWCSVSMVYYGVSLNPPNLSNDKYMYVFIGGALEIPSYLLLWPANKYIGRKKTLITLYMLCAVAIFGAATLTFFDPEDLNLILNVHKLLLGLSLLGKFAITSAFQLVWAYTVELIPTDHRSAIVAEASACGRLGSIASPYIIDLLGREEKWLPSAIFGSFSIITAVFLIFLPETKNMDLSDSVAVKNKPEDSPQSKTPLPTDP